MPALALIRARNLVDQAIAKFPAFRLMADGNVAVMSPKPPRPEEALAFEIVHRVLDAEVDHHDDNSAAGMVDAMITYADGTQAALEVTTLGDQAVMQARSLIVGKNFDVPGAQWAWHAAVSAADSRTFEQNVAALVLKCEREEVGNVKQLDAFDPAREYERRPVDGRLGSRG